MESKREPYRIPTPPKRYFSDDGCVYCSGGKSLDWGSGEVHVQGENRWLLAPMCGGGLRGVTINYCPMCGKQFFADEYKIIE